MKSINDGDYTNNNPTDPFPQYQCTIWNRLSFYLLLPQTRFLCTTILPFRRIWDAIKCGRKSHKETLGGENELSHEISMFLYKALEKKNRSFICCWHRQQSPRLLKMDNRWCFLSEELPSTIEVGNGTLELKFTSARAFLYAKKNHAQLSQNPERSQERHEIGDSFEK